MFCHNYGNNNLYRPRLVVFSDQIWLWIDWREPFCAHNEDDVDTHIVSGIFFIACLAIEVRILYIRQFFYLKKIINNTRSEFAYTQRSKLPDVDAFDKLSLYLASSSSYLIFWLLAMDCEVEQSKCSTFALTSSSTILMTVLCDELSEFTWDRVIRVKLSCLTRQDSCFTFIIAVFLGKIVLKRKEKGEIVYWRLFRWWCFLNTRNLAPTIDGPEN